MRGDCTLIIIGPDESSTDCRHCRIGASRSDAASSQVRAQDAAPRHQDGSASHERRAPATKTGAPAAPRRPNPALLNPAGLRAKAPDLYRAKFVTTKGDFIVEVHRDWAPLGADRFYNLVKNRFFTNAAFFRVVPNFIVQFGLNEFPEVNAAWENAKIKDDPVTHGNKPGTLVFATAGPGTRTTQLFINFKDNGPSLDGQGFSAFGEVTEGMDIVQPDLRRLRRAARPGHDHQAGQGLPRQELPQDRFHQVGHRHLPRGGACHQDRRTGGYENRRSTRHQEGRHSPPAAPKK